MVLNNELLRIFQNAPRKARVLDLYENFNTLNIPDLHNFQLLVLGLIHIFFYHKENIYLVGLPGILDFKNFEEFF